MILATSSGLPTSPFLRDPAAGFKPRGSQHPPAPLGAYGLRLSVIGLSNEELGEETGRWLIAQDPCAPALELDVRLGNPDFSPSRLDGCGADVRLIDGARLRSRHSRRRSTRVSFTLPAPIALADLIHPYLAPAAALAWQWAGAEALHAGAVAIGAGAVLLLGGKGAGKSTLLATLAREHGLPVLADDLAVIHDNHVLAGPRAIDLRGEGADGEETSGDDTRDSKARRLNPPQGETPHRAPLQGEAHHREPSQGEAHRAETLEQGARRRQVLVRGGERLRTEIGACPARLPVAGSCLLERRERPGDTRLGAPDRRPVAATSVSPSKRLSILASARSYPLPGSPIALLELAAAPMFTLSRPYDSSPQETADALLHRFG